MDIFYRKHYAAQTPWWLHAVIVSAIWLRYRFEQLRLALSGLTGHLTRRQWEAKS
jgi:hypothetical protein